MTLKSMHKVFITGATGFVGDAVLRRLIGEGDFVRVSVRGNCIPKFPSNVQVISGCDLGRNFDWGPALSGCDTVIHCAARVHVMKETAENPLCEFRRVNVDGTLNLARHAASSGIKRFIFLSSIKVNGEYTPVNSPYTAAADPEPKDPYGVSKREAEDGLNLIAFETGMEVVTIRPPLVYGPGVKANFHRLIKCVLNGIPLPLGAIHNKRSLVSLSNLVDLIVTCVDHPEAANKMFLVSDDEDLSTTDLLYRIGLALGKKTKLIPVPMWMFQTGSFLIGRADIGQRLCCSLQVDISKTKEILGWTPPYSVDESLIHTVEPFRK